MKQANKNGGKFNIQRDNARFESLAPYLSAHPQVRDSWGVLNVAQCAEQDGERDGCWSVDYLCCYFGGHIGDDGSKELERDCLTIWNDAL